MAIPYTVLSLPEIPYEWEIDDTNRRIVYSIHGVNIRFDLSLPFPPDDDMALEQGIHYDHVYRFDNVIFNGRPDIVAPLYKLEFNDCMLTLDISGKAIDQLEFRRTALTSCSITGSNISRFIWEEGHLGNLAITKSDFDVIDLSSPFTTSPVISKIIDLQECNIKERIQFKGIDTEHLHIENCICEGDVILSNINAGEIELLSLSLFRLFYLYEWNTEYLSIKNILGNYHSEVGNIQFVQSKESANRSPKDKENRSRETARFLKNCAIKQNDTIEALRYKQKEMIFYHREVFSSKGRFPEKILLWLNYDSNRYGLSWVRGIVFIFKYAFIFFLLIMTVGAEKPLISYDFQSSAPPQLQLADWFAFTFLDMINLFNFKESLGSVQLNGLGAWLYYLSKIFVSYGIYQTIAAFRKYGK